MRKIQVKRGTAANTPTLADGELGLQTDTGKLMIGNNGANLGVAMDNNSNTVKDELNAAIAGCSPASHTHTAAQVGARPNTWMPSKWDVGLGNVDNTADSQKSVNYANTSGDANAVGGREAGTMLSEIDTLKTSVANGKAQIASAISDRGGGTGADFGTMANNIRAIASGNVIKSFTTPGVFSWTAQHTRTYTMHLIGGGGGGGASIPSSGGSGYLNTIDIEATAGTVLAFNVASGGASGRNGSRYTTAGDGTAGESTYVNIYGTVYSANGGSGGTSEAGGVGRRNGAAPWVNFENYSVSGYVDGGGDGVEIPSYAESPTMYGAGGRSGQIMCKATSDTHTVTSGISGAVFIF